MKGYLTKYESGCVFIIGPASIREDTEEQNLCTQLLFKW